MKKFQFRLEPLRRYREFLERRKQLEVAKARHDVISCEQSIVRTRAARSETENLLETDLSRGVDAARFMRYNNYIAGLDSLEASENERRDSLLGTLKQKQQELARKTVEKKAIERLKSRQKEAYYEGMLKEEQKTMDDMIILRQARSQKR